MICLDDYTSSLVPYQDLKIEGLTLMIIESGHINCLTSHPEVNNLLKKLKERNSINILSWEEQDFSSPDASGAQRLIWLKLSCKYGGASLHDEGKYWILEFYQTF